MKKMSLKKTLFLSTLLASSLVYSDQVILDDVITSGSICAGMDCVNNESFGFDTLRLKENNLRIKFIDTSSTGSFPHIDWEMMINDSSNGGENHFSIKNIDADRILFKILDDGQVSMGNGLNKFVLTSSGDLNILGTLSDSSDVNLKENIVLVNNAQILKKIIDLPVSTWNYKDNKNKDRHIGSMAQDFYKAFEYGPDNRHISPKDAAFVAIVGVKELNTQLSQKDKEIQALKIRLEKLEKLVNNLTLTK